MIFFSNYKLFGSGAISSDQGTITLMTSHPGERETI